MPRLTTPWFQQKNMTPQTHPTGDSLVMDEDEIDALTERLMKPTQSSQARMSMHMKMDTFMDQGRHSWTKMDLCKDSKKCLWTPHGTVKKSFQTKN